MFKLFEMSGFVWAKVLNHISFGRIYAFYYHLGEIYMDIPNMFNTLIWRVYIHNLTEIFMDNMSKYIFIRTLIRF